jgi:hypothetical protein
LNIFDNKEECYECFYNLCDNIGNEIIKTREDIHNKLTDKFNEVWKLRDKFIKD